MNINDELAAWGEPPLGPGEEERLWLLDRLVELLQRGQATGPVEEGLSRVLPRLYSSAETFRRHAGLTGGPLPGQTLDEGLLPPGPALPDPFPGEFRVRELLGEGAFGQVWLADDLCLGRPVALKTLRFAGDARKLAALRHEAGILARFCHRNLVQVYAWRQSGPDHYLVLQYVEGGSLKDRLEKEGPLPWELAGRYLADVGEGLLEVHARGIVHRDIKPANILWHAERDEALLTDFGVAAHLADGTSVGGTPLFMAPEGFAAGQVSPKLDVYSLAATLFCLVAGEAPFRGDSTQELHEQARRGLPPLDPRCRGMPEALEEVLRAGLSADPGRRPGLKEFLAGLRGALNQSLADSLAAPAEAGRPAGLRLAVSKEVSPGRYQPVAATHPTTGGMQRNMKKVPRPPEQVSLRTGDRVRIEVLADRTGYLTVFNVGPTGDLHLLYPDEPPAPATPPNIQANVPLHVLDVELEPPAGRERVFAVWTGRPLALQPEQLQAVAERGEIPVSELYQATRNMVKVKKAVGQLRPEEGQVAVLEVDHGA